MPHSRSFYLLLLCLCMLLQHIDIDECADRNMSACSQVCVNSVGSYRCECEKGYFLEEDRKTCTKRERGESSLLSLQFIFFLFKANVCLCWGTCGDRWERLRAAASCSSVPAAAAVNPAPLGFFWPHQRKRHKWFRRWQSCFLPHIKRGGGGYFLPWVYLPLPHSQNCLGSGKPRMRVRSGLFLANL